MGALFFWLILFDSEGGGLESDKIIEATYDETSKAIKLKVKPKGSKERKNLIK